VNRKLGLARVIDLSATPFLPARLGLRRGNALPVDDERLLAHGRHRVRAVAVMACDDEVAPLQARIEAVTDEGDLEEVYDTKRHLLYVACTRARDHLLVTGVNPASEFLEDLRG
jgi:ATP-dependent exoDNAse (exonuclease V) beta subunit